MPLNQAREITNTEFDAGIIFNGIEETVYNYLCSHEGVALERGRLMEGATNGGPPAAEPTPGSLPEPSADHQFDRAIDRLAMAGLIAHKKIDDYDFFIAMPAKLRK